MTYRKIGILCIILGGYVLSLELYGLQLFQYIDRVGSQSCWSNPANYFYEPPVTIAFLIAISLIIWGFLLLWSPK